jgi:hypothetical protein
MYWLVSKTGGKGTIAAVKHFDPNVGYVVVSLHQLL